MELLRFQSIIHKQTRPCGRLLGCLSQVSLTSADFLLAATIICLDLYHGLQLQAAGRPSGDTYTWGEERQGEMLAALQRSKEIYDDLRDESMDAWKAAEVIGVMIENTRLALAGADSNTPAVFEPQDEKQNAAMTLGLLSSGMPPGPAAFGDPANKMAETPLAQGGLGTTAEIPAAPSPFSNIFGQMPDLQLNLDWVSFLLPLFLVTHEYANKSLRMLGMPISKNQP